MLLKLDAFRQYFHELYASWGMNESLAINATVFILFLMLVVIIYVSDFVARRILINWFSIFSKRTKTNFDDLLVSHRAPRTIAHVVPLVLTIILFPIVFEEYPELVSVVEIILKVYGVLLIIWILRKVLLTFETYFKSLPRLKDKPIDSYIQVVMLFMWIIGLAFCVVIITGVPLWTFFTTMGAASAILLLIFKDTILGLVASIQIAINDTVRIGDWITMEKFGADGNVIEINLSTVQVCNFDKTITVIPTFALNSEAYKNWRGMIESGGRRIKRSVVIKASSIHYLTKEEVNSLKDIQLITSYLETRESDINQFNESRQIDKSKLINGRNLTNFGVFRKYLQEYIQQHSAINKDMTIMVRQLEPTPQGIPLEVYAFSSDKRWENYEYIMADIFDHVLAAIPYFNLELFELNYTIKP